MATDISKEAIAVATENAARHGVSGCIEFRCGAGFVAVPAEARYELIISNPPYIPSAEIASLQPEVRDFDPHAALDGGPDGLDLYRLIAKQAPHFLQPQGGLMVEIGDGQAKAVRAILEPQHWVVDEVAQYYSPRDRFLVARRS